MMQHESTAITDELKQFISWQKVECISSWFNINRVVSIQGNLHMFVTGSPNKTANKTNMLHYVLKRLNTTDNEETEWYCNSHVASLFVKHHQYDSLRTCCTATDVAGGTRFIHHRYTCSIVATRLASAVIRCVAVCPRPARAADTFVLSLWV